MEVLSSCIMEQQDAFLQRYFDLFGSNLTMLFHGVLFSVDNLIMDCGRTGT
jgi:hypothetical protein